MEFSESNLYPALYDAADAASLKGQKKYLDNFKTQLGFLLAASFVGLFQTDNPVYGKYVAALSLALFAVVLAVTYQMQSSKHDSNWYYGRAIAESIKTLTWRFMIKGEPFTPESDSQAIFCCHWTQTKHRYF